MPKKLIIITLIAICLVCLFPPRICDVRYDSGSSRAARGFLFDPMLRTAELDGSFISIGKVTNGIQGPARIDSGRLLAELSLILAIGITLSILQSNPKKSMKGNE